MLIVIYHYQVFLEWFISVYVFLVRQFLDGDICYNFVTYFNLQNHSRNTRNNGLNAVLPKVKLKYAQNGFYFMGAKVYNNSRQACQRNWIIKEIQNDFRWNTLRTSLCSKIFFLQQKWGIGGGSKYIFFLLSLDVF